MDPVVFDNKCLCKHSLYNECGSLLNEVSKKDYPNKNYFDTSILCLDMDRYETQVCLGQADCTTDAVIGISSCVNKQLSNPRLLLVELKMDCKGINGLSKTNLESKVTHTKQLLGSQLPINPNSVFVFSEGVAAQANHWVSSMQREGGEIRHFLVYSLQDFKNNIRSYKSMPYHPINQEEKVLTEIDSFIQNKQYNSLFEKIRFWLGYSETIKYRNQFEYDNIKEIIKKAWGNFRKSFPQLPNDDDEINAQILDEDIITMLR